MLALAAALLGAAGGWTLHAVMGSGAHTEEVDPTRAVLTPVARPAPEPADEEPAGTDLDAVAAPVEAREAAPSVDQDDGALFSPALLAYARREIAAGWMQVRKSAPAEEIVAEGMGLFDERTRALPADIGRLLGRRENERDAARAAGSGFAILLDLALGGEPALDVALDREGMEELFAREMPEHGAAALDHAGKLADVISDGVTLQLPPGVFSIDERDVSKQEPYPRDVTIAGAGKDATLLLIEDFSVRSKLRNFALRDCTIFVTDGLFDLRREPALVRMDRVRMVGQDCGHGGCSMFSAPSIALLATDCEFLGGYGSSPGNGELFDARGGVLKRFDRCRIVDQFVGFEHLPGSATVVFDRCELLGALEPVEQLAQAKAGVKLVGCVVTYAEKGAKPAKRDLDDLFPQWKQRLERL